MICASRSLLTSTVLVVLSLVFSSAKAADNLSAALVRAYQMNPDLMAARAQLRATDELVPQAKSGFRPRVTGVVDGTLQDQGGRPPAGSWSSDSGSPRGASLSLEQNLFDGFKTTYGIKSAESTVLQGRETLRSAEQDILLMGVEAYMNVLRDTALYDLRRNNVAVLSEQRRQAQARFDVGEITRTDVAQTEARLARAHADMAIAESVLRRSLADFRAVIGTDPKQLKPAKAVSQNLPSSLEEALQSADRAHPAIGAAIYGADAAQMQIRVAQGDLLPNLGVTASLSRRLETTGYKELNSASVLGRLSIPIYEGGLAHSRSRAAYETAEQRRLQMDSARDKVRAAAAGAWSYAEATKAQLKAGEAAVKAAELALTGVREEAKVGQRTTLDLLNAQQELLDARSFLVQAQRDRVVSSYRLLSAVGRLDVDTLGLPVQGYNPRENYRKVRNKWVGPVPSQPKKISTPE